MAKAFVGVSGWRYASWRGDFYPQGLRQEDELAYAAEHMTSIEINGSFYSLQRPSSYERWRAATPDGFRLAVKGGRFITHLKQLRDVEAPLANFFASGVLALADRLGPILWQLPERLAFDPERLDAFARLLPRTTTAAAELAARHNEKLPADRAFAEAPFEGPLQHALEARHESFDTDDARAFLAERDVCTVIADSAGRWPTLRDETGPIRYVRLHGETELYRGGYSQASLARWAERIRGWLELGIDAYVYFDNDADGRAPHDAVALLKRLA
ncbi:DUF72 domain-containing protein [Sinomonas sp. JGH33]|uniref:DUF72 domain-containing protein n=1 Tax=Sinomonas terricola TaxID=3110330 RepID=A0ABU5T6Y9_9MICC|nr:DUF72 domain-containing protein [Sinomonas sp. JGH33]MEA5455447.1 DUF72 domain-containing protein [Sinomonas sp. JGH33]